MRGQRSPETRKRMAAATAAVHMRERGEQAKSWPAEAPPEMRQMPRGLTPAQRRLYKQTVRAAPWLKPADIRALVLWVKATDAIDRAEDLNAVGRQMTVAQNLGRQLGLTPAGRRQLGIEESAVVEKPADPWGKLTVAA